MSQCRGGLLHGAQQRGFGITTQVRVSHLVTQVQEVFMKHSKASSLEPPSLVTFSNLLNADMNWEAKDTLETSKE